MDTAVIVAIISLVGTLGGSFGGVLVSSKLTNYRLQQLENKVQEHNNYAPVSYTHLTLPTICSV